jgi:hypothetical protein
MNAQNQYRPDMASLQAELRWLRAWTAKLEEELLRIRLESIRWSKQIDSSAAAQRKPYPKAIC